MDQVNIFEKELDVENRIISYVKASFRLLIKQCAISNLNLIKEEHAIDC